MMGFNYPKKKYDRQLKDLLDADLPDKYLYMELLSLKNTLLQRKYYYRGWLADRAVGKPFRDTRKVLSAEDVNEKVAAVDATIDEIKGSLKELRQTMGMMEKEILEEMRG